MRADRLLSILLLLQTGGRLTARDLAERLEVSERTIHRDMEALSTAGVPVTAERGAGGGWNLLGPYKTDLTGLNAAEIQALFMSKPDKLMDDLGLRGAYEAALVKLLAALPDRQRPNADDIRARIHIDGAGWHSRWEEEAACFAVVQEAVWCEQRLNIGYQREDGVVERVVDPLGLVAKKNTWYLVAGIEGEIRTYRISRIVSAHLLEERVERPEGFDLAGFWEQSTREFVASLPRYAAVLRVAPDVLSRVKMGGSFARVESVGEAEADGWHRVAMRFDVVEEAVLFVLGFGGRVRAVEPRDLWERVREGAERVLREEK